eukprot:12414061-Karenia_brevis.AAC.1
MSACSAKKQLGPESLDWAVLKQGDDILRQSTAELLMSRSYPEIALQDEDHQPIYKYAYYVHLRLRDAWRVP